MGVDGQGPGRGFMRWVRQDWAVNAGYRDSQVVLLLFRFAQWAVRRWGLPGAVLAFFYRWGSSLLLGVELPPELEVGPRLRIFHPHGIVLNPGVTMGADCVLRQNVTIGNVVGRDGAEKGIARVGRGVEFGAGCVVVGDITVGDHARIGALALVQEDVPERGVVVAARAHLLRIDPA
jgi:putative colanic acid biosynthesis acetyltransferase WcaB